MNAGMKTSYHTYYRTASVFKLTFGSNSTLWMCVGPIWSVGQAAFVRLTIQVRKRVGTAKPYSTADAENRTIAACRGALQSQVIASIFGRDWPKIVSAAEPPEQLKRKNQGALRFPQGIERRWMTAACVIIKVQRHRLVPVVLWVHVEKLLSKLV
ncbi:hypothetical protein ISCGN_032351 [Ixodes scapularis]